MEQVRQRIIAGYHLRPLDRLEMQAYIEHRLRLVDWNEHPKFEEGAYDRLYGVTGGIPRRVNNVVDRVLLYAALEELDVVGALHVETVFAEMNEEFGHKQSPLAADEEGLVEMQVDGLLTRVEALEQSFATLNERVQKDRDALMKARAILMGLGDDDE
jgi:hypothetical protein